MALNFPSSPIDGNVYTVGGVTYVYNATKEVWAVSDITAKAQVYVSNTAPSSAEEGDLYWDEEIGKLLIYYTDGDSSQWVEASSTGSVTIRSGASAVISDTAPPDPQEGDLYFDNELLKLFVYYDDGDTQQWIEASPASPSTGGGGASRSAAFTMSVLFGG